MRNNVLRLCSPLISTLGINKMIKNSPRKKKWIAVSIIAALSTCFSALMKFFTNSMRDSIIEHKNLGEILAQIKETNVDTSALSGVLRESPPLLFIFIATVISVAITVWFYHKILNYLCKSKENPNNNAIDAHD